MNEWPEGVTNIDRFADIIDAPEEGGCYVARMSPKRDRSEVFDTHSEAIAAYLSGKARWQAY